MPNIDFTTIVNQRRIIQSHDWADWLEWRYCYEGGRIFRDEYLEKYSDREGQSEFERRRDLTPIPGYARNEINKVKNSLSQRLPDVMRRNGSKDWKAAVAGDGRGIDRRGSSMNSFITKNLLAELLVIGKVGCLVDAPRVNGPTAADVPPGFRPYLRAYHMEAVGEPVPAPAESPSDWAFVILENHVNVPNLQTGKTTTDISFNAYMLDDERLNAQGLPLVTVKRIDEQGNETDVVETDMTMIPFVVFDIQNSLMRDACSYQITLLNMISADSSFVIDSNFPLLTKQRSNSNAGAHLIGEEDEEVEVGTRKGMWYEKNMQRPGFIAPPTNPMTASLKLRRELKEEVRELITGTIANMGDDGSVEAGLAFIGSCLNDGESRLWDHWQVFESRDPARRNRSSVSYPEQWSLKTDEDRLKEANAMLDLSNRLPGRDGKVEMVKATYDKLWRGKATTADLDKMKKGIENLDYTTSDPEIAKLAGELGWADAPTLSQSMGYAEGVAEKAKAEREEKAKALIAAQTDAGNGSSMGVDETTVDPNSGSEGRRGEVEQAQLEGRPGVRGEGEETDNGE